ncbi:FAD-binding oxidoreductase [Planktothrix mougeotii]|uniref:FAD-binding oxidoreductase n=1 Tax=Planktothrix mougeotii LEGE 06226 TaxID=1828728 RepID=A0ABR9UC78_9CYAN|nr:FAD-binding oxidoreductase [Planktothrix mougeotii]MBE9144077.1 FAD-binding oxidoreductase [Planktothrix mougeotii LEGE 06226]
MKTWGHKWGFADTQFVINEDRSVTLTGDRYNLSGYKMPNFLPYIEEELGIKINSHDQQQEITEKSINPPTINKDFCQALANIFPSNQYTFEDRERLFHSHGQSAFKEIYKVLYSKLDRTVDMVFCCQSELDAKAIINLAIEHNICLVPFGGGTNVSCALKLPENEKRMVVSVDMRRMDKIEWIDPENLRACVQAGITGQQLEEQLRNDGFICGHEPDSLEFSTLGGWISTNASGMKKNRYGNIEQIVENITLITPTGTIEQIQPTPRSSMGIQIQNLLFGSEGNLGLITKAVIKINPFPEVKKYGSLVFPNFELGVKFLYNLAHNGFVPASIRLVDNNQFRFSQALKPKSTHIKAWIDKLKKIYVLNLRGFNPHQMVAATIVMEGSVQEVAYQQANIYALAKKYQGLVSGAENGHRGYMLTYAIAYMRDFLLKFYIIGETFETSVSWSQIHQLCHAVDQTLKEQHQKFNLPGKPYLSYRISQIYHTGVCLYFMFGFYSKGVEFPEVISTQIEHSLRQAIMANGGSISHHHGVGKSRQEFIKNTLSDDSIELIKQIKHANDPQNIFGIDNFSRDSKTI